MSDITAIILAAGMGVRMGPRGTLLPKGLIRIGGTTLIERSVASLRAWGARRTLIVTGHLAEQYRAVFAGGDVALIHNPHYATTGSLRTLMVALGTVEGPCVILESDLIYARQALDPIDAMVSRLVTSDATGAGDEVYVWARPVDGAAPRLQHLSKDLSALPEPCFGELVGITGLSAGAAARMRGVARRVLERDPEAHYEQGLVALAQEMPIEVVRLAGLPWAEIDDEAMLERARRLVYPRLAGCR